MPWVKCYFADGGYHAFYTEAEWSDEELLRLMDELGAEDCFIAPDEECGGGE